jgi:hypothetical protein
LGVFSKLFGSAKTVDTLVDGAVKGIDALVFTEEEKSEAHRETFQLWLKMQEVVSQESSVRSVTRRILAVMIVGTFLFFLISAAVAYPISIDYAKFLLSLAKELGGLTLAIGCFYFGVHLIRGLTNGKQG